MKTITKILLFFTLCLFGIITGQNERPINELLEVLSENHMGSVTDVFTLEEIQVIKNHFAETTFPSNTESVLLNKRYATTQSVSQVQAADINPSDISNVQILLNSPIVEFPGAGVHLRGLGNGIPGPPRVIIIDNNGHVWQRDPGENPININDLGELTGIPVGHSVTGIEVIAEGSPEAAIFGMSTDGTSSILIRINLNDMTVTPVGGNNGLVLPIALAQDGNQNLITIDIDDDNLYQINKTTGAATLIGSVGYGADFGQAMFYDPFSDQIINLAYNAAVGDSELRTVNPVTGMTTSLGTIQPGTIQQFGWGSIYDRDLLGVNENGIDGFSFYPNPSKNTIYLNASNVIESIEIYSILGQLVVKKSGETVNLQVDISALQSGNYILKVNSVNQSGVYRFIKQ